MFNRDEVEDAETIRARNEARLDEMYPHSTFPIPTLSPSTMRRNPQVTNLTLTLQRLPPGCNRVLIVIERLNYSSDLSVALNLSLLSNRTGFDIVRVDELLGGKGSQFAKVKAQFDSPNPAPMALLSFGMNEKFLAGTDLGNAKAFITVGNISESILIQTLGRVFRPVVGRDATQPVHMYTIHTPRMRRIR